MSDADDPGPPDPPAPRRGLRAVPAAPTNTDPELEAGVLGALILHPEAIGDVIAAGLHRAHFTAPSRGRVFDALVARHVAGQPVDARLIWRDLENEVAAATLQLEKGDLNRWVVDAPMSTSVAAYAGELVELRRRRRLAEHLTDALRHVQAGDDQATETALAGLQDLHTAPAGVRKFITLDLAELVVAGPTEPDWVPGAQQWLYANCLTSIQSEPGVGKTWVALWLALNCIQAGADVIYLDEEGGPELVAERLIALGADPEAVRSQLHYVPFPGRAWDLADQAEFAVLLEQHPATRLAVFDSLPDFLALAGKSEDSAQDVTWFVDRVLNICRDHGVAQIVLDHLIKPDPSQQGQRTRSRYGRGSGAKLGKADATFLIETGNEFDAHTSGKLKLWKTKDRRGQLPLPGVAASPVILNVNVDDGRIAVTVTDPEPGVATAQRHHRPTRYMERVSMALEGMADAGISPSGNALVGMVTGTKATKMDALRCLIGEGHVAIKPGSGMSILHTLVKPYREIADPRSENYMTGGSVAASVALMEVAAVVVPSEPGGPTWDDQAGLVGM